MRVWIIETSEPTPVDKKKGRLWRNGLFAESLVESGHEVLWWSATFHHIQKVHRFERDTVVTVKDRYKIRFLHGPGYKKNVSLARFHDHRFVAKKFLRVAQQEPKPDVILCSCPTIDLSDAATQFAKKHNIPVVIDVRDLWPDVFVEAAPEWARSVVKILLFPQYMKVRGALSRASAIIGSSSAFVDWGVAHADRNRTDWDKHFPFGYVECNLTAEESNETSEFWRAFGIDEKCGRDIVCFFGTIGHQFDFDAVVQASRQLGRSCNALFVLCGEGDRKAELLNQTADMDNIIFPGWVDGPQIWRLMQLSQLALAPYLDTRHFRLNLTNKPIEYLAGGLPILCGLASGIMHDMIHLNDCGVSYGNDASRLSAAIVQLLDDKQKRVRMAQNARSLFEKKFVAKKVYREMVLHVERIAKQRTFH